MSIREAMVITVGKESAYNFRPGETLVSTDTVTWRRQTRWDRLKDKIRNLSRRDRQQVVSIEDGIVTLATVRWSWLRLKWVRV